jgi:hypothetical protein
MRTIHLQFVKRVAALTFCVVALVGVRLSAFDDPLTDYIDSWSSTCDIDFNISDTAVNVPIEFYGSCDSTSSIYSTYCFAAGGMCVDWCDSVYGGIDDGDSYCGGDTYSGYFHCRCLPAQSSS